MNTSISQKQSFYDFEAESINGKTTNMQSFKGKTIIVVNTASKCGLTPQYAGLEALYKKYKDQGLIILGFPCNQFAEQEAGNNAEIQEFCQVNYGVSFPMFNKIDVNGANTHPIFAFLKSHLPDFLGEKVKWNFTKFVVDKTENQLNGFCPLPNPKK
jgi:glutathione peroxidase